MKSRERTRRRSAGRGRPTRCARRCVKEARARDPRAASSDLTTLVDEHVGEIKAHIVERDGKIVDREDVPEARHVHRRAGDRPGVPARASSGLFPGRDFTARHRPRSTTTARRPSSTAAASVLTVDLTNRCNMMCDPCFMDANQVGYVHELTLRRRQEDPRRRDHDQAAPADDGAVLRRRADASRRIFLDAVALRARGRLLQRAGGDQRHPLRAGAGVRAGRPRRRACASPTCSSTASAKRPTRTARSATCSTSSCARSRTCTRAGIDVMPGRHHRQRRQQRPGRHDRQVRDRELRQDQLRRRSSRCRSPAATRTSTTRRARSSATRCRTWRTT